MAKHGDLMHSRPTANERRPDRLHSRRRLLSGLGLAGGSLALGSCDVWSLAANPDPRAAGGSPLSIQALQAREFRAGEIRLHQITERTATHTSYLMSYDSDGLRLTGTATLPTGTGPFPVVVLNHGFFLPAMYDTGDGTRAVSNALAPRGFITLAPDYRGLGGSDSDGRVNFGARLEFAIDVLNLVAAIESLPEARTGPVGMWGHSLGADLALRAGEVNSAIGPIALWAPLSAWMDDLATYYRLPTSRGSADLRAALSPGNFVQYLRGPVAIHQGENDLVVRPAWARRLHEALLEANVASELVLHPGIGHELNLTAWRVVEQTADFFGEQLAA